MKLILGAFYIFLSLQLAACAPSNTDSEQLFRTPTPGQNQTQNQNQSGKPKYGPEAVLLSQSHEYILHHEAPDYWALSPYYIAQQDDKSCSVASATMIVNAARAGQKLTADDELATQQGVLKKVNDADWDHGVGPGGQGINLDQFRVEMEKSLKAYGIDAISVEAVHVPDVSPASLALVHKALVENEKAADTLIVANFIQGVFTGDADVGHFAPVGAFDEKNKKVLIFDPDRQWYEPYWVSEETFVKGMAPPDSDSGYSRGFVFVRLKK